MAMWSLLQTAYETISITQTKRLGFINDNG